MDLIGILFGYVIFNIGIHSYIIYMRNIWIPVHVT